MEINIAAAPVIRGQMKHSVHALHGRTGDARLAQVRVYKLDLAARGVFADVVEMPARQIIDDADFRAARE
jgi:hypothetical protein